MKYIIIEIKTLINQLNIWKDKAEDKINALESRSGEIIQYEVQKDKGKKYMKGRVKKKKVGHKQRLSNIHQLTCIKETTEEWGREYSKKFAKVCFRIKKKCKFSDSQYTLSRINKEKSISGHTEKPAEQQRQKKKDLKRSQRLKTNF